MKYNTKELCELVNFESFIHDLLKCKHEEHYRGSDYINIRKKSVAFWDTGIMYKFEDKSEYEVHRWGGEKIKNFIIRERVSDDTVKYTLDKELLCKSKLFSIAVNSQINKREYSIKGALIENDRLKKEIDIYKEIFINKKN